MFLTNTEAAPHVTFIAEYAAGTELDYFRAPPQAIVAKLGGRPVAVMNEREVPVWLRQAYRPTADSRYPFEFHLSQRGQIAITIVRSSRCCELIKIVVSVISGCISRLRRKDVKCRTVRIGIISAGHTADRGDARKLVGTVDGSFVEANAARESRIPREQLAEAAQVHHTVRQYLREVEEQNPVHEQDQVSTTDPDSTYATKGGTAARLGYYDNYLVDNDSCVIVGVQATAARMSQETVAAQNMLTRFAEWQGRAPESVAADTTYGNGEFLQWLVDRGIAPYMRTRDSIHRKRSPLFGPERFTYEPEHNRYLCPAGQPLNYGGRAYRNRAFNYIGTRKRCGACALKAQCTSAPFRSLNIHQQEPARQRARELANTPEFARAQRQRKKVEALFAELKNQIGLRRLRLRRLKFVREQFFMAAAAQNLKRLVRFLSQPPASTVLAT